MGNLDKDKFFRLATGIVFLGFMIAIIVSYSSAKKEGGGRVSEVPVISAEKGELKVKPEEEGGMEIPFRDSGIYDSVNGDNENIESSRVKSSSEVSRKDVEFKAEEKKTDLDVLIEEISHTGMTKVGEAPVHSTRKEDPFSVFRAQLASLKTEKDALRAWKTLKGKYSVLSGLGANIEKAKTSKGTFFRVQTSLISKEKANHICSVIKSCFVVRKK